MATIKQYETSVTASGALPGPGANRLFATADAFGGLGKSGDRAAAGIEGAADALNEAAQRTEVSDVAVKLAQARGEWSTQLKQRAATAQPGDTTFADKFTSDFATAMSKTGDNISTAAGRRAFERGHAELSAHFLEASSSFQLHNEGVKAKQDFLSMRDANGNTLINDPGQFESILRDTRTALNDPSSIYGKMPPEARAQLERDSVEHLAQYAVQGTMRNLSPKQALDELNNGKWDTYLNPTAKNAMIGQANQRIHADLVQQEHQQIVADREKKRRAEAANDGFIKQFAAGTVSMKSIMDNPDIPAFGEGSKASWLKLVETTNRREDKITTDPNTFLDLFKRIHLDPADPRKINDQDELLKYVGEGITMPDLQTLRGEVVGKRTQDGDIESKMKDSLVQVAKSALTSTDPLLHIKDPKGDEQFLKFMTFMLPEYQRQRQAGKTPLQLLNPDSPEYIGKAIEPLKRSPQQRMADMFSDNPHLGGTPGTPPAAAAPSAPADPNSYKSAADVTAAYKAGKIARPEAARILKLKGWAE